MWVSINFMNVFDALSQPSQEVDLHVLQSNYFWEVTFICHRNGLYFRAVVVNWSFKYVNLVCYNNGKYSHRKIIDITSNKVSTNAVNENTKANQQCLNKMFWKNINMHIVLPLFNNAWFQTY